jgi:hypothetical protein
MFLGCLCVLPVFAQQDACQQRTIPVSVETKDGTPAPELSSADLEGTYQHKAVHIKLVAFEPTLPRIILLLDTSGSMQGTQNDALDIAEELLSKIPPATEVGLAFFAKDLQPVALPTSDHQKVMIQLEGLRKSPISYKGGTALWASILDSLKMLGSPRVGDAIYLISDGGNNSGKLTEDQVAATLIRSGVRLFGLTSPSTPRVQVLLMEADSWVYMQQMIENTGGTNVFLYNRLTIKHDLDEQRRQLIGFSQVDIDLAENVDKPREWKLAMSGLLKSQRDNLVLKYPHVLVPCH